MIAQTFKVLSEIQWRSKRKRRTQRFVPCTCRACGDEQAYPDDQHTCKVCGTIGELVQWRPIK